MSARTAREAMGSERGLLASDLLVLWLVGVDPKLQDQRRRFTRTASAPARPVTFPAGSTRLLGRLRKMPVPPRGSMPVELQPCSLATPPALRIFEFRRAILDSTGVAALALHLAAMALTQGPNWSQSLRHLGQAPWLHHAPKFLRPYQAAAAATCPAELCLRRQDRVAAREVLQQAQARWRLLAVQARVLVWRRSPHRSLDY